MSQNGYESVPLPDEPRAYFAMPQVQPPSLYCSSILSSSTALELLQACAINLALPVLSQTLTSKSHFKPSAFSPSFHSIVTSKVLSVSLQAGLQPAWQASHARFLSDGCYAG